MATIASGATSIAALITGVAAIAALVFSGLSLRATRDQYVLSEQGQITDRFTKAVEELGSPAIDVRLGGIYALERIAHDSPRDQPTVFGVVGSFVRTQAPLTPTCGQPDGASPPVDVEAAVTVIARRDTSHDRRENPIDLSGSCLSYANLAGANLNGAILSHSNLVGADLDRANLNGASIIHSDLADADLDHANLNGANIIHSILHHANLNDAHLSWYDDGSSSLAQVSDLSDSDMSCAYLMSTDLHESRLIRTDLTKANMYEVNLEKSSLVDAILVGANLNEAHLDGAALFGARFTGADLLAANLDKTNLAKANLSQILFDDRTTWPAGFIPPPTRTTTKVDDSVDPFLFQHSDCHSLELEHEPPSRPGP